MEMSKRHLKQWDKQTYGQIEVLDQRVTEIKTHVLKKKKHRQQYYSGNCLSGFVQFSGLHYNLRRCIFFGVGGRC